MVSADWDTVSPLKTSLVSQFTGLSFVFVFVFLPAQRALRGFPVSRTTSSIQNLSINQSTELTNSLFSVLYLWTFSWTKDLKMSNCSELYIQTN